MFRLFRKKPNSQSQDFQLNRYPYYYQCPKCKDRFQPPVKVSAKQERQIKANLAIKSELPFFFECHFCHNALMKPIGYSGKPSARLDADGESII